MRVAKWIIASLAVVLAVLFLYTWKLSQPIFDGKLNEQTLLAEIQAAPIDQTLTFARLQTGEVMLVFSADSGNQKAERHMSKLFHLRAHQDYQ